MMASKHFVMGVLVCLAGASAAHAGSFTAYTDRAAWTAAATAAGLTITTETFTSQPAGYPTFAVGPAAFNVDSGIYDAAAGNLRDIGAGFDIRVNMTDVSSGQGVFALAYDFVSNRAAVDATDVDGDSSYSQFESGTFVGLIGTAAFDPANPAFGDAELVIDSNLNNRLDNLSVAYTAVPEPTAALLAAMAGLGVLRRRRRR